MGTWAFEVIRQATQLPTIFLGFIFIFAFIRHGRMGQVPMIDSDIFNFSILTLLSMSISIFLKFNSNFTESRWIILIVGQQQHRVLAPVNY